MQWKPLRLTHRRWKAVYIVGGGIVLIVLMLAAWTVMPEPAVVVLATALQVAWIYGGTRIFRGRNELLLPPRPWWRMTARPAAGFALAAVFAVSATYSVAGVITEPTSVLWWTGMIEFVAFAVLYAASSVRLLRGRSTA